MSKWADDALKEMFKEHRNVGVDALQMLATSVFIHWRDAFNAEKFPEMVCLGQIHDIWNLMYRDMLAIHTLEKIVGVDYKTEWIKEVKDVPNQ